MTAALQTLLRLHHCNVDGQMTVGECVDAGQCGCSCGLLLQAAPSGSVAELCEARALSPVEPMCSCDECGAPDVGWFAKLYRKKELRNGRSDPGNLCSKCAGSRDGKRIAEKMLANE